MLVYQKTSVLKQYPKDRRISLCTCPKADWQVSSK